MLLVGFLGILTSMKGPMQWKLNFHGNCFNLQFSVPNYTAE